MEYRETYETPRRSVARGVLVMFLYLVPAVFAYRHAWAHPSSVVLGAGGRDPGTVIWFLAWVPWAIQHGHNPLFTVVANAPFGINLVAEGSTLALGFLASPITVLWGPVATFNVLITLAFPLSAGAAYLLARRFTMWRPAAFVAGLLYGFSPYMVGQGSDHLNLVFVPLPPLIFLVLHDLVIRQSGSPRRLGVILAGLVVCQFFISTEILATTFIFAMFGLIIVAATNRSEVRRHFRFACRSLAVAALISITVLIYPIYMVLAGPQHISGPVPGFDVYRSALFGPLLPSSLMRFSTPHLSQMANGVGGNLAENGSYLGPGVIILVILGALLVRRSVTRLAGSLTFLAFVISLGSHLRLGGPTLKTASLTFSLPMPAAVLEHIPLIQSAFPIRYTLFVDLFAGLVIATTLETLRTQFSSRVLKVGLPAVLAVVALLPLLPAWPYKGQGRMAIPSYFMSTDISTIPPGSVVAMYPWPDAEDEDFAQVWQAESHFHFRMTGGYFLVPSGHSGLFSYSAPSLAKNALDRLRNGPAFAETPVLRRELRSEFASWHVQSIIAAPPEPVALAFFTWLTGRPPSQITGGVAAWYRLRWRKPSSG